MAANKNPSPLPRPVLLSHSAIEPHEENRPVSGACRDAAVCERLGRERRCIILSTSPLDAFGSNEHRRPARGPAGRLRAVSLASESLLGVLSSSARPLLFLHSPAIIAASSRPWKCGISLRRASITLDAPPEPCGPFGPASGALTRPCLSGPVATSMGATRSRLHVPPVRHS